MKPGIYPRCESVSGTIGVTSAGGTGVFAITMPENTVENDIMLMMLCHKGTGYATMPAGWTLICQEISGSTRGEMYWRRAASDEAGPYEVNGMGSYSKCFLISFGGCKLAGSPIDQYAVRANSAGTTGTAGVTTTNNNCLIISAAALGGNASFSAWAAANITASLYEFSDAGYPGELRVGGAYVLQQSSGSTGATTWTSTSYENVGICVALIPDSTQSDMTSDATITGAPTNTSAAAAYNVASLPLTIIQTLPAATADTEFWFKYEPSSIEHAFGFYLWANPTLVSQFLLGAYAYYGDDLDNLTEVAGGYMFGALTRRYVVPVLTGETYYIKVRNLAVITPANQPEFSFRLSIYAAPNEGIAVGDLLVNNDSVGYPLVVLDKTDGHVKQHYNPHPAGETGSVLDTGELMWNHGYALEADNLYDDNHVYLYDSQLVETALDGVTVGDGTSDTMPQIRGEHSEHFYVVDHPYNDQTYEYGLCKVHRISPAGVIENTWTLDVTYLVFAAVNIAENTLYYAAQGANALKRWNLTLDSAGSDLDLSSSMPAGYGIKNPSDLLVLADDSILLEAYKYGSPQLLLRFDSSTGNLLNTYDFFGTSVLNRLALDSDVSDTHVWVWTYPDVGGGYARRSTFSKMKISDGSVTTTFTLWEAIGDAGYPITADPEPVDQEFFVSWSCPFVTAREAKAPEVEPGAMPSCVSVTVDIDEDTLIATGTGTGTNATAWRVVEVGQTTPLDSGTGTSASFSFQAEYNKEYQLQFSDGATWSSTGCTFSAPDLGPGDFEMRTLMRQTDIMEGRAGWFYDSYTPNVMLHYGDEGDNVHAIMCGTIDGGVYQLTGDSEASLAVSCHVITASEDQKDTRYNKLYGDIMLDADANAVSLAATALFNNGTISGPTSILTAASRTQDYIQTGTSEWQTARNIALDIQWEMDGSRSYLYSWEPRWTEEGGHLLAYNWETCHLNHDCFGYLYLGYLYLTHISTANLTLTITVDEVAQTPITIAHTSGVHRRDFIRLPVMKGKLFKYRLSSATPFRVESDGSELLVKEWGELSSYGQPIEWRKVKLFDDVAIGSAE